jgi:hypothetical protein
MTSLPSALTSLLFLTCPAGVEFSSLVERLGATATSDFLVSVAARHATYGQTMLAQEFVTAAMNASRVGHTFYDYC